MSLPAMRSFSWLIRSVCSCSVDSVCSCRRRRCKGAVLSDTSHPALITLTHCYSRWLSGTASVQHSHMPAPISHSTGGDSREMRQRYLYVCVKDGCHTQITLPLPPSEPHLLLSSTQIQTGIQRH